MRVSSFEPVIDARSRVLVLGSMPSAISLAEAFYYAHPRNAFWQILVKAFSAPPPACEAEKRALLARSRVALWDVARSCERVGSLDSDMRDIELNDVSGLLDRNANITAVLLNGGQAARLYKRLRIEGAIEAIRLPSTSPAYTLRFEEKYEAWRRALQSAFEED